MRERKSKKEKRKKKKDLEIEISSKEEPASNSEGHNIKVYEDIFLCLGQNKVRLHCSNWPVENVSAIYEINFIKTYLGSKEQIPKTATFKDAPDLLP